jgi:hypothetical protein
MTDSEPVASVEPEIVPRRRSKLLQWNIATLLLLMTAVGIWTSYLRVRSDTDRMDAELDSLRQLTRELVVNDPAQYSIVERHEEWHGDHVWDLHLPEGSRYVLKLATREIAEKLMVRGKPRDDFPDTGHVLELAAGKHVISLEKTLSAENASARAVVDGELALKVSESSDWCPGSSFGFGGSYNRSTQAPLDQPLELIRIRFYKQLGGGSSKAPDEPYNGVLLWIERKQ